MENQCLLYIPLHDTLHLNHPFSEAIYPDLLLFVSYLYLCFISKYIIFLYIWYDSLSFYDLRHINICIEWLYRSMVGIKQWLEIFIAEVKNPRITSKEMMQNTSKYTYIVLRFIINGMKTSRVEESRRS